MTIKTLFWDEWHERVDNGSSIEIPTWEEIEDAIRMLDGKARTIVNLSIKDDAYMTVAGGLNGLYVAFETTDNLSFYNLTDSSHPDGKVLLDIGGQPGEYRLRRCNSLDDVLAAAKSYFDSAERNPALIWQCD